MEKKKKKGMVGNDEVFIWLVYGSVIQTLRVQFFASTFCFYLQVGHQFLLF